MPARTEEPANIQHVPLVVTPLRDLVFYDRVNEVTRLTDARLPTAIGTAHPKVSRWPDHKLVAILPDPDEGWLRYVYAADRANQEDYNWELIQTEGLKAQVRQTFVVKRSEVEGFTNAQAALTGSYYYLPDTVTGATTADQSGTVRIAFDTTGMLAGDALVIDSGTLASSSLSTGYVYFASQVSVTGVQVSSSGGFGADADTIASGASGLVLRTATSIRPPLPGSWTQMHANVRKAPPEIEGLYVVLEVVWENAPNTEVISYELDELTGTVMTVSRKKIRTQEASFVASSVNSSGLFTVTETIDAEWSWAITRKVTALAGTSRSYDLVLSQGRSGTYWPKVLQELQITAVNQRAGGVYRYSIVPIWLRNAYRGPVNATLTESWSLTAPTVTVGPFMDPGVIEFDTCMGRYTSPECLHPSYSFVFTTGTSHPSLAYTTLVSNGPATNVTDWPPSIVVDWDVKPWRGGFLSRKLEANAPI